MAGRPLSFARVLRQAGCESYEQYLESEHWLGLKRSLCPQGAACIGCGSIANITLHHITYRRLGKERPGDFMCLCRECHGKLHEHLDSKYPGRPVVFKAEQSPAAFSAVFGRPFKLPCEPEEAAKPKRPRRQKKRTGKRKKLSKAQQRALRAQTKQRELEERAQFARDCKKRKQAERQRLAHEEPEKFQALREFERQLDNRRRLEEYFRTRRWAPAGSR